MLTQFKRAVGYMAEIFYKKMGIRLAIGSGRVAKTAVGSGTCGSGRVFTNPTASLLLRLTVGSGRVGQFSNPTRNRSGWTLWVVRGSGQVAKTICRVIHYEMHNLMKCIIFSLIISPLLPASTMTTSTKAYRMQLALAELKQQEKPNISATLKKY